jgi:hypothetical protein
MAAIIGERRCETCRFVYKAVDGNFQCRRGPPSTVIPVPTPNGVAMMAPPTPVSPDYWCHAHEKGIIK